MKIVTSYQNPDLDGVSSMYAYAELLNKQGDETKYFIWDKPRKEVEIVCEMFKIKLNSINELQEENKFIFVDTNSMNQAHSCVKTENVIEIIDHHGISKSIPEYINADIQIAKVGAAATLVAEKYKLSGYIPSRESAILLYYGIVSNSMNFKSSNTTKRDIEIANWLKEICSEISEDKIKEIFIAKSQIDKTNLREAMECNISMNINGKNVIVGQIEIVNVEEFLKKYKDEMIKILNKEKEKKSLDYIFINCVDILNGYIVVLAPDNETIKLIKNVLKYDIDNTGEIRIDKVIPRKEMIKILRNEKNF